MLANAAFGIEVATSMALNDEGREVGLVEAAASAYGRKEMAKSLFVEAKAARRNKDVLRQPETRTRLSDTLSHYRENRWNAELSEGPQCQIFRATDPKGVHCDFFNDRSAPHDQQLVRGPRAARRPKRSNRRRRICHSVHHHAGGLKGPLILRGLVLHLPDVELGVSKSHVVEILRSL